MRCAVKFILIIISLLNIVMYGQQSTADSLVKELNSSEGVHKVDLLNKLSDIYQYISTKTAIDFANAGIKLATSINYKKGLADSYGSLGYCYINLDNNKALEFTQKALEVRINLNDEPGIATSNNVLGVIYYYTGDYLKAIDYHLKALALREKIGDEVRVATSYNNIALVHTAIENYETALEYLNKALAIRTRTDNKRGIAIVIDNIGDIYSKLGNYDEAFKYFNKALTINQEIGNKKSEAYSCFNIANIFQKQNDSTNAFKYYRTALDIYVRLDEKNGVANVENGMAKVYMELGMIKKAIEHSNIALATAQNINSLENIVIASKILQYCYENLEDYKNAYRYANIFINSSYSLRNFDNYKRLAKVDFDYKLEKIQKEKEVELNKQKSFITYLIITLILSLMIVVLIIIGYNSKRRLNKKLNLLNDKLIQINSTKDRFFSIIAHDLRGPFTGLIGISEILSSEEEKLNGEEIKYYNMILNLSLKKQFELLNDLLEWSRLQNENINLIYETIPIFDELNKLIEALEITASLKNIKLINEFDKDLTVYADKNMFRLVLRNLISNGIKFTNQNGYIKISALQNAGSIEVTIEDNGVGIPEEDIGKLFRIDVHHSTQGTIDEMGTGLGLILCKEIIEKHSGNIRIGSKVNEGTKIIFSLPSQTI